MRYSLGSVQYLKDIRNQSELSMILKPVKSTEQQRRPKESDARIVSNQRSFEMKEMTRAEPVEEFLEQTDYCVHEP